MVDLYQLAKGVNSWFCTVLGSDKKLPISLKSTVYDYVDTLVAIVEQLTVRNALLTGAVGEARQAKRELRDELLRSVVEGVEKGVQNIESKVQEGVSSLENAVTCVSLQQCKEVALMVGEKGSECGKQVERVACT